MNYYKQKVDYKTDIRLKILIYCIFSSLENLGSLPYKIRIQAKDDVYETTRRRMAVAEENIKNKW